MDCVFKVDFFNADIKGGGVRRPNFKEAIKADKKWGDGHKAELGIGH